MLIISVPAFTKRSLIKNGSVTVSKLCLHLSRIQTVSLSVEVFFLIIWYDTTEAILKGCFYATVHTYQMSGLSVIC